MGGWNVKRTQVWWLPVLSLTIWLSGCASCPSPVDNSVPRLPPPASIMEPAESPETAKQLNAALQRLIELLNPTSPPPAATPPN